MTNSERQPRRWSLAEDQILHEQVEVQQTEGGGKDWCRVASALPGRTNKDCRKRWHNSVAEGLNKGQWSRPEDQLLLNGVHQYGSQWTKVATCVSSRSADQCAKRWQQSLDPRLDRSEWREDEDLVLITAVNRLGRHWKDIQQQHLPYRSKNCVKNRYSVLSRRMATKLVLYDDGLESSSSDPGTPPQTEAEMPLGHTPMILIHQNQQAPYMQGSVLDTSGDELSWTWSGLSNPNVLMTPRHHESLNMHTWPTQYSGGDNSLHPTNHSGWYDAQTNTASQYPAQYSSTSYPSTQGHMTSPRQTHVPPSHFYASTFPPNTPSTRQPTSTANIPWSGYRYRDTAPFG
ncbi:chromatin binding [Ascochyta rabiei]|uniref:Chromatin binding n=1 Tax=Didymella rabiei TaxID=5454 RepID=A0A163LP55_DIDRA|nr:chromatin binding [Ascochyta rabiei]